MKTFLLFAVIMCLSLHIAITQSTNSACIINASDIANITEFLISHNQTTIQVEGVPNDTFSYNPDCMVIDETGGQLVIEVDDLSTLAQFEGVYKSDTFTTLLSLYNASKTSTFGTTWNQLCAEYNSQSDMTSLLTSQTSGLTASSGMSWICLIGTSFQSGISGGGGTPGQTNEFGNSLFVSMNNNPVPKQNFAAKRFKSSYVRYPIIAKSTMDYIQSFLGANQNHPVHTHLVRPHFVHDTLGGLLHIIANTTLRNKLIKDFWGELSKRPKEDMEFIERIKYSYNNYIENHHHKVRFMNPLHSIPRYINSDIITDLKDILHHNHMDGSFVKLTQVLLKKHHIKKHSHHKYNLHNGAITTMKLGHQHLINTNLPTIPATFPISDIFNPYSGYWDTNYGWNGTGPYDRYVIRSYHLLDWIRVAIWLFEEIFYVNTDVCKPGIPFLPDPTQCNFPLLTAIPPLTSANFTPTVDMCNEFNSFGQVYLGAAQIIFGSLAYNLTLMHPGWKPYVSWLIRYDDPYTPTVPVIGDQVLPCVLAKILAILILFSGVLSAIVILAILRVAYSSQITQVYAIRDMITDGVSELEVNSLNSAFEKDYLSSREDKMKYF
jgi:hypothetical protein